MSQLRDDGLDFLVRQYCGRYAAEFKNGVIMGKQTQTKKLDVREIVALVSSAVVIVVALVYWSNQIGGVMEMLEMAYG